MEEKLLTQRKIAELAGVTEASVSRWVSGGTQPEIDNVAPLARATNTPFSWLAYGEGSFEPDARDIRTFIKRVNETLIPRLNSILEHFDWMAQQDWLSASDHDEIWKARSRFSERRMKLSHLVRNIEQLPEDKIYKLEERLFGDIAKSSRAKPLLNFRAALAWFVGLTSAATDEEILRSCARLLKDHAEEDTSAREIKEARKKSLKAQR